MKLNELSKEIKNIKTDEETKEALMKIIDLKIENDMDKVLNKMDAMDNKVLNRMDAMDNKVLNRIDAISNSLKANTEATNSKIEATNSKIDGIKWFIAIAITITGLLIALSKYIFH